MPKEAKTFLKSSGNTEANTQTHWPYVTVYLPYKHLSVTHRSAVTAQLTPLIFTRQGFLRLNFKPVISSSSSPCFSFTTCRAAGPGGTCWKFSVSLHFLRHPAKPVYCHAWGMLAWMFEAESTEREKKKKEKTTVDKSRPASTAAPQFARFSSAVCPCSSWSSWTLHICYLSTAAYLLSAVWLLVECCTLFSVTWCHFIWFYSL